MHSSLDREQYDIVIWQTLSVPWISWAGAKPNTVFLLYTRVAAIQLCTNANIDRNTIEWVGKIKFC